MVAKSFSELVEALEIQTRWESLQIKGPHISRRKKEPKCHTQRQMFTRYSEIKLGIA